MDRKQICSLSLFFKVGNASFRYRVELGPQVLPESSHKDSLLYREVEVFIRTGSFFMELGAITTTDIIIWEWGL